MTPSAAPARQPSGLTKHQTRSTLAFLNWNLGLRQLFGTISGSASFVFVAFALQMGIPKERMGWIGFMASAACIMQMAGLLLSNRVRNKKRMLVGLAIVEPLVLLVAVLVVPILPQHQRLYGLILATFASAAVLNLTRPLSDDWIASTIPSGLRESFLGRRIEMMNAVSVGVTLFSGFAADKVQQSGVEGLSLLLALGALAGVMAALPLRRAVLPSITARASVAWPDMKGVFLDKAFRRYMLIIMLLELPYSIGASYCQVMNLKVLGLSTTKISFMTVGFLVTRVVLARASGRWVSRFGAGKMIVMSSLMFTLFFASYAATAGGQVWPVFVGWILAGLGETFFGVAQGTKLYSVIPHTPARSAYFAVFNLIILSCLAVSSLISMFFVQLLKDYSFSLGGWTFNNFHCLYVLVSVLMLLCTGAIGMIGMSRGIANGD